MLEGDENKLNKIEELKDKLRSRNYRTKIEYHDGLTRFPVKDMKESWPEELEVPMRHKSATPFFRKLFFLSVVFFVVAFGYALYSFFISGHTVSKENIEITVQGNNFAAGGEELSVVVGVHNKNSSPLLLVDLVLEYPRGRADDTYETERIRESLGEIKAGELREETMDFKLFGAQGSVQTVKIFVEYRVEGSNAIFVKDKSHEVNINSTPINLSVDGATNATPNQELNLDVSVALNSPEALSNILLRVDYPAGFQFVSANPSPTFGSNVWDLGNMSPGAESEIEIIGKMVGVFDGEEKIFRLAAGERSTKNQSTIGTVFSSLEHKVLVEKPFLDARLFINGESEEEHGLSVRGPISGEVRWVNNLETSIRDLEIRAKVSGSALNRSGVEVEEGFYDSAQNTIIWNRNSMRDFVEVNPGQAGAVFFSVEPLPLDSSAGTMIVDPAIKIEISITGREDGGAVQEVKSQNTTTIKLASNVSLATKALYYSGPFTNSGPIPPKAEQATTYAIVWSLSNSANLVSGAEVRASLPQWATFVGSVSPQTEDMVYNPMSKEIIWSVGSLARGVGISQPGREVAFQVLITPSVSQVGTLPVIINDAVLTGFDNFAGVELRANKPSLNTNLSSDPEFPASGGRVVK